MIQRAPRALRGIALAPNLAPEPPADLIVRTKRMTRIAAPHDSRITGKAACANNNRPSRNAVGMPRVTIAIELRIARDAIKWPTQVGHDDGIALHLGKGIPMVFGPLLKFKRARPGRHKRYLNPQL